MHNNQGIKDNSTYPDWPGQCNIENWPPTQETKEYMSKCLKDVKNYTTSCLVVDPDEPIFSFDVDCLLSRECMCTYDNYAANTIFNMGPILYPFSIEFSILVGNELYKNIDKTIRYKNS